MLVLEWKGAFIEKSNNDSKYSDEIQATAAEISKTTIVDRSERSVSILLPHSFKTLYNVV